MKRQRLKILYSILTDKATYIIYNTETVKEDSVNIQIERISEGIFGGKAVIILEDKISEESFGAMAGASFSNLVHHAVICTKQYISNFNEEIFYERGI